MGGRGSSSGMGRGGGGGSMRSEYNSANEDRLAAIERGDRAGIESAIERMDRAGNAIFAAEATDSVIESVFDKYIDSGIREEGVKKTEGWVKTLASTNKDGSPRKTAVNDAKARSSGIVYEVANRLGISISSWNVTQSNRDKVVDPMMRVARRRMSSGHLK